MGSDLGVVMGMSVSPSELSRQEDNAIRQNIGRNQQYFFDSNGFRNANDFSDRPQLKKAFAIQPSDHNISQERTKFTEWSANRDHSETFFYQTSKRSGVFEDNFRCTNYELALEFGRDPSAFIEPTSKPMRAIYIPPKKQPIQLDQQSINSSPIGLKELPLVSPLGAIAGKKRWDQKGALRIANHTSIRFGHDSYVNDRKLRSCEPSQPT